MSRKLLAVILIVAFAAFVSANHDVEVKAAKLKLSFFITSQCRDTMNFITKQLKPVYTELKEYMDVEFVPWGKAKRASDGTISCQFGKTDCQANKIQSCTLNQLKSDQPKQVEYINCEMSYLAAVSQDYKCVKSVGVQESVVKSCYESAIGDQLQMADEAKTKTITMKFVPTIVLNDVYDANVQSAAFSNLKKFVCGLLEKEAPAACA